MRPFGHSKLKLGIDGSEFTQPSKGFACLGSNQACKPFMLFKVGSFSLPIKV